MTNRNDDRFQSRIVDANLYAEDGQNESAVSIATAVSLLPKNLRLQRPCLRRSTERNVKISASLSAIEALCERCGESGTQMKMCSACSLCFHPHHLEPPIDTLVCPDFFQLADWKCNDCSDKHDGLDGNYPWCLNCGEPGGLICCRTCRS